MSFGIKFRVEIYTFVELDFDSTLKDVSDLKGMINN